MRRPRKLITGWRIFFLTLIVMSIFLAFDERLVLSANVQGFYPPDTTCIVSSWDFPLAWGELDSGDVVRRMQDDWPSPHASLDLAIRKKVGIRLVPIRWRVWLGDRTVIAFAPEGMGVTAYPGYFLRWADSIRGLFGAKSDADGISHYRGCFYAWRNGFLIASTSRAYMVAALAENNGPRLHSEKDMLLTVQWTGEHEGYVNLKRGAGLPVSGQLIFRCANGEHPLTLPQAWPQTPIASITARNADDLQNVCKMIDSELQRVNVYPKARAAAAEAVAVWGIHAAPAGWDSGADHVSFALLDVGTKQPVPVPSVALALRYAETVPDVDPLEAIVPKRTTIPYKWNECDGFMTPLLGMELSPCIAKTPHDWLIASNEKTMSGLAGKLADGPACAADVDIAVRASWAGLGKAAEPIATQLGDAGVFARMDTNDVSAQVTSKIKALSKLGQITLDGVAHEGTLKFSGYLAQEIAGKSP